MSPTFKIITLGCKVNFYESEALRESLIKDGYLESKSDKADYFFVNTCAVTNLAERQDLQKVRSIARQFPDSKIVVSGCSSQIHKAKYLAIKQVIQVRGTSIRCSFNPQSKSDDVNPDSRHFNFEESSIYQSEYPVRAYIKIQDGCNNFCSYCVVPFSRGNSRYRKPASIIKEAKALLDNGYHELIIGGIDTGSYHDPDNDSYDLTSLLKDLLNLSSNPYRIRVSSIEISQIKDDYIKLFKDHPNKLCPHFHIPLQSGSDRILKLMNRKYSLEQYLGKVAEIKSLLPFAALSTDIITGFPTETNEDFLATYDAAKKVGFMRIHAFPYSQRPFTAAGRMANQVDVSVRRERVKKLLSLSDELEKQYLASLKGHDLEILIEHRGENNTYSGYSENYLPLSIKSKEDVFNTFVKYKVC
ncbi:MAG: tRNA (N(6)-L-threonylcarbamoyladenosine(37)-C(2))-methylthiotransferase MtaB [Bacilli bacterium]